MDYLKEFESICKDHEQFRTLLEQGMAEADEASKFYLRELSKGMDAAFVELKQTFPGVVSDLAKRRAAMEDAVVEAQKNVETVQREMQDLEAQAEKADAEALAPPPPPPEPTWDDDTLDADLRQYRAELLELLSDKKELADKKQDFREIWQDWSRFKE